MLGFWMSRTKPVRLFAFLQAKTGRDEPTVDDWVAAAVNMVDSFCQSGQLKRIGSPSRNPILVGITLKDHSHEMAGKKIDTMELPELRSTGQEG